MRLKGAGQVSRRIGFLDLGLRIGGPNCEEQLGRAVSGNVVAEVN